MHCDVDVDAWRHNVVFRCTPRSLQCGPGSLALYKSGLTPTFGSEYWYGESAAGEQGKARGSKKTSMWGREWTRWVDLLDASANIIMPSCARAVWAYGKVSMGLSVCVHRGFCNVLLHCTMHYVCVNILRGSEEAKSEKWAVFGGNWHNSTQNSKDLITKLSCFQCQHLIKDAILLFKMVIIIVITIYNLLVVNIIFIEIIKL